MLRTAKALKIIGVLIAIVGLVGQERLNEWEGMARKFIRRHVSTKWFPKFARKYFKAISKKVVIHKENPILILFAVISWIVVLLLLDPTVSEFLEQTLFPKLDKLMDFLMEIYNWAFWIGFLCLNLINLAYILVTPDSSKDIFRSENKIIRILANVSLLSIFVPMMVWILYIFLVSFVAYSVFLSTLAGLVVSVILTMILSYLIIVFFPALILILLILCIRLLLTPYLVLDKISNKYNLQSTLALFGLILTLVGEILS